MNRWEDAELARSMVVDGVELAWDSWGPDSAATFVLCHGITGSAHDFALNVGELAARRRVLAFDQRGHGRSQMLGDESRYSLGRLAADLVAVIEDQAGGAVDLLGHSMGGWVALCATIERPDLVRSLILMDTSAWRFGEREEELRAVYAAFLDTYDPARGLPDVSELESLERPLLDSATPSEWRARKDELTIDPYALRGLGRELLGDSFTSLRPRLAEVACPVTVVAGEHDRPYVDQAHELATEVCAGSATIIAGAYHSPQLTHRRAWQDAVEAHLAGVGGSRRAGGTSSR